MNKYEAIEEIMSHLTDELVVSNIGVISKLVYMAEDRDENFYMTGSMGLTTSIGLGLALGQERKVVCLEGDGSILMNLGSMATIGSINPGNLVIFVLDDQAYQSTGGHVPLIDMLVDLGRVAVACGIKAYRCESTSELDEVVEFCFGLDECVVVHVLINEGSDAPKIPMVPVEIKERFMKAVI